MSMSESSRTRRKRESINLLPIDRYWFLTWTTYGTWLPGDRRGFIGAVRPPDGSRRLNNQPGTPVESPNPRLRRYAASKLSGPAVVLNGKQAHQALSQFLETTSHRKWLLIATGIMATHVHAVVGVPGDPAPEKILGDLKSYASRALNRHWTRPQSETWWTESGSKRKLADERSVESAVRYILDQPNPLLIWTREDGIVFDSMKSGGVDADGREPGS